WPDRIPADIATAEPQEAIANLPAMGTPAPIVDEPSLRPMVDPRTPRAAGEAPQGALGDARAALVALHGTARLFYPALDDLWDSLADGQAALDARLLELLADVRNAPPGTKDDLV